MNSVGTLVFHFLLCTVKKTKTIVIRRNVEEECKVDISVDGKILEQVKQYLYLVHLITEDGRCETEIKKKVGNRKDTFYEH